MTLLLDNAVQVHRDEHSHLLGGGQGRRRGKLGCEQGRRRARCGARRMQPRFM